MKVDVAKTLKPGQAVFHRRYGSSSVKEVQFCRGSLFGIVIHVENEDGRKLLAEDCGFLIPDLLVDNPRSLQ